MNRFTTHPWNGPKARRETGYKKVYDELKLFTKTERMPSGKYRWLLRDTTGTVLASGAEKRRPAAAQAARAAKENWKGK